MEEPNQPIRVLQALAALTSYSVNLSGDDHYLGNLQIRFGTPVNADAVTGLRVSFVPTRPSRRASERTMRAICCYCRERPSIPNSPTNTLLLEPGVR